MKDLINILNERVGDNAYGSATLTTQGIGGSRFTKTNRPPGIWEAEDLPIVAKRLKDVFDQVGDSEFWKNHFKSKYGIHFPTNLKDINKKQALAMNKFGTHMNKGMNEAGIAFELEPATGGDKKLKIFKNKSEADRFAQQAANIKKATQMEEEKEEYNMDLMRYHGGDRDRAATDAYEKEYKKTDEISYDDAKKKGLKSPDKADISKDKDISDYELKRGMAVQKAIDGQEKNEMHTNDMGKNNWVDDEGRHAKMQLQKAAEYSIKLTKMMDDMTQLPSWVQSKITKASDYMSAVYHYLDYEMTNSQNSLMENMDKHRKRPKLMEGAMKRFFKAFDGGSTDEELVHEYAREGLTVPEAFVSKARKQWESLKKAKLELELSEKEAKGFRQVQTTDPTDVMGMEPQSEEKHLASGLFK